MKPFFLNILAIDCVPCTIDTYLSKEIITNIHAEYAGTIIFKEFIALQKGVESSGKSLTPAKLVAPSVKAMLSVIKVAMSKYLEFILSS